VPDCIRLSLQVKAEVTRAAAVGFPPKQAEEHFLHGPAMRPEKITLPAAGTFASLADHGEIITLHFALKGIRFFLYSVFTCFHELEIGRVCGLWQFFDANRQPTRNSGGRDSLRLE